jgi:hypothetical protein
MYFLFHFTKAKRYGRKYPMDQTDVLVIGGKTAGTMAGIKAKQANPDVEVLILEKANIRRIRAIALGNGRSEYRCHSRLFYSRTIRARTYHCQRWYSQPKSGLSNWQIRL